MQKQGPVWWPGSWDDTGFQKGKFGPGSLERASGETVSEIASLSVATWSSSLPIAYRLYLPKAWATCRAARTNGGAGRDRVSDQAGHRPGQIRTAVSRSGPWRGAGRRRLRHEYRLSRWTHCTRPACGGRAEFDDGLGAGPAARAPSLAGKIGRPPRLWQRSIGHQPVSVKHLAMSLPSTAFQEITWREGTDRRSCESASPPVRVRASSSGREAEPTRRNGLLIRMAAREAEPTKYWMATLPQERKLRTLSKMAHRWIIQTGL